MIPVPDIKILKERCVGCGDCVRLCPQSGEGVDFPVLGFDKEAGEVRVENREGCFTCYTCVEFCRAAAIVIYHEHRTYSEQPELYPERPVNRII